jgi:hypothetical protein
LQLSRFVQCNEHYMYIYLLLLSLVIICIVTSSCLCWVVLSGISIWFSCHRSRLFIDSWWCYGCFGSS